MANYIVTLTYRDKKERDFFFTAKDRENGRSRLHPFVFVKVEQHTKGYFRIVPSPLMGNYVNEPGVNMLFALMLKALSFVERLKARGERDEF